MRLNDNVTKWNSCSTTGFRLQACLLLCDRRMHAFALLDGSATAVGQSALTACTLLHNCLTDIQTSERGTCSKHCTAATHESQKLYTWSLSAGQPSFLPAQAMLPVQHIACFWPQLRAPTLPSGSMALSVLINTGSGMALHGTGVPILAKIAAMSMSGMCVEA